MIKFRFVKVISTSSQVLFYVVVSKERASVFSIYMHLAGIGGRNFDIGWTRPHI